MKFLPLESVLRGIAVLRGNPKKGIAETGRNEVLPCVFLCLLRWGEMQRKAPGLEDDAGTIR